MIAYLSGTIHRVSTSSIVVLANGIGFVVNVPKRYQFEVKTTTALEIYAHTNQEQGMQLFGFHTPDERTLFGLILGCSGIGPKIGLAVLSELTPSLFASAILTGDIKTLSAIDGIGRKKAESLILHLKDRIEHTALVGTEGLPASVSQIKKLNDVLTSLGYHRQEINGALEEAKKACDPDAPFEECLRKSLSFLAKRM